MSSAAAALAGTIDEQSTHTASIEKDCKRIAFSGQPESGKSVAAELVIEMAALSGPTKHVYGGDTHRSMLQMLYRTLGQPGTVVYDGCSTIDEYLALKIAGFTVFHIVRPDMKRQSSTYTHPCDHVILNNGTLDQLRERVYLRVFRKLNL